MRLRTQGLPEAIRTRLRHAGLITDLADTDADTASIWLHGDAVLPHLRPGDLLMHFGTLPAAHLPDTAVIVRWQESPFAAQYGYVLLAGGQPSSLRSARCVLDALAPAPGAWLHSGGRHAPGFLMEVSNALGGGLLGMAGMMQWVASQGFNPLWLAQQQLQSRLALMATQYLTDSANEQYECLRPQPNWHFTLPGHTDAAAPPAHQVAKLLLWLHAHLPAMPSPAAGQTSATEDQ